MQVAFLLAKWKAPCGARDNFRLYADPRRWARPSSGIVRNHVDRQDRGRVPLGTHRCVAGCASAHGMHAVQGYRGTGVRPPSASRGQRDVLIALSYEHCYAAHVRSAGGVIVRADQHRLRAQTPCKYLNQQRGQERMASNCITQSMRCTRY